MAGTFLTFGIEPFIPSYFNNGLDGAYPHVPSSTPLLPFVIQFGWQLSINDAFFVNEIQEVANSLLQAAIDDGQDVGGAKQIRYPNYVIQNTSLSELYGNNVQRLKNIRQSVDPENVMNLTGGFRL